MLAKVFIGVAKRDLAGTGHADKETGKVGATVRGVIARALRCHACKCESPTGVLLEEVVILLVAKIHASRHVMMSMINGSRSGKGVGAVAVKRAVGIAQACDAARKPKRGRTPIRRVLIVASDAVVPRNILAILKVRRHHVSQTAEFIACVQEDLRLESMRPVDV